MLMAFALRKPLFVRHCGNWLVQTTWTERFWKWFMERFAGGRNVMLATGGLNEPPSRRNRNIRWIFSTSLTSEQIGRSGMPRQAVSLDAPRLITVCRQEPDKGTDLTIMSLPHLLAEFPGIRLDVIGNGSALKKWVALADSLGVTEHVVFHGGVVHSQVLEHLRGAEIFCFPTAASEGFPKAVLEALACGLPVITTPVSVLPLLIDTGCGFVIPERTPSAIAEAVRSLILNPELYRSMSVQAMETARQYSLEQWGAAIGHLLSAHWGELRSGDKS
ncbi:MAG: glycosyltransferase family 4 protein [Anaerolineae bacterium]|nr:glycosyltransferase family 4 protein [Anaerolineae bacterium]